MNKLYLAGIILAAALCARAAKDEGHFTAKDVFKPQGPLIFKDDFSSGRFNLWNFSEDDRYRLAGPTPERLSIVDAPGLPGKKAVRFVVPRGVNSFRAEVSLPHEKGFQERWYGERLLVPAEWVFDPTKGNDLVMQWHAIPGNGKATYPNLEISIGNTNWFIRQNFGEANTKPTRLNLQLATPVRAGVWVAWVIHAKWSPRPDGLLQIWQDGQKVLDRTGPNVYGDIGLEYTPYLKTGIYHPEWHIDKDRKREAFAKETPVATKKIIYATEIKVGDQRARFEDVAPKP